MIYLDNAATTPISKEVLDEMMPYLTDNYGNPSSIHSMGRKAKQAIEIARERVSKAINAQPEQIIFTSGATEGNNLVRQFFTNINQAYSTTEIEHPSNLHPNGEVCDCFSIMSVNNETGNIIYSDHTLVQAHELYNAKLHSDCTQAYGHLPIDVKKWKLDFATFSGHKIHAPKGVGVLYVREPKKFKTSFIGGGQEKGIRHGTENVAGIVGLGKAFELYNYDEAVETENFKKRLQLIKSLQTITNMQIQTDLNNSIATTLTVSFKDIEGEALVLQLDLKGICVSSGSACHSGNLEPSYVLKHMNVSDEYIDGTIRISFSRFTSTEDLIKAANAISECVRSIRNY